MRSFRHFRHKSQKSGNFDPLHSKRFLFLATIAVCASFYMLFNGSNEPENIVSGININTPVLAPTPTEMNANFMSVVDQCFLPTASVYGYTLRISSGFRSADEQNELYKLGRTEDGHIVTEAPAGKSIHNYGYAIDVVDRWRGFDIDWEKLGRIGKYCGLEHADEGDYPHFELRDGLTTDQFKQGYRPRELVIPCALMTDRFLAEEKLTRADLDICGAPNFNLKN